MSGKKLLIVEDSAVVRERIRDVVQVISGISVVGEASDAEAAIALLERHDPDLLTLDMRLANGSSGIEVLRHLRRRPRPPQVIVLSSEAGQLGGNEQWLRGVDYVLDKVMDFHRLPKILSGSAKPSAG